MAQGSAFEGGPRSLIQPEVAEKRCIGFIQKYVRLAGASGAVVGVSGGVDSATVLGLSAKALGPRFVQAAILPSDSTPDKDTADAETVCRIFGIGRRHIFNISAVMRSFPFPEMPRVAYGNLKARLRMAFLYYLANRDNCLVVGTGDRSEDKIGFFTKYGDGGVDISPIADLYKTEVRILAKHLGVPASIADKPSSPQLWDGHSAEQELGARYEAIDDTLMLFERGVNPRTELSRLLEKRIKDNKHKGEMPPILRFR